MSLKILLADDSMTAQNMGKKILTDAGYEVIAVSNGAAAVKKIAEHKPDLAILDIYMPGYTGLEVCERVKGTLESSRTPVLLTVGKLEPYRVEDGARVRADGVIVKPFEATDLLAAIEKLSDKVAPKPAAISQPEPRQSFECETSSFPALKEEPETGASERFTVPQEMQVSPAMDFEAIGIEPVQHEVISAAEVALSSPVEEFAPEATIEPEATPWQPAGFVSDEPASIDKDDEPIFSFAAASTPAVEMAATEPSTELPSAPDTQLEEPAGNQAAVVEAFEVEFTSAPAVEVEVAPSADLETTTQPSVSVEPITDPALLSATEVATAFPTSFGTEAVEESGADPNLVLENAATEPAQESESADDFEARVAAAMAAYDELSAVPGAATEPSPEPVWHAEPVELDSAEAAVSLEAEMAQHFSEPANPVFTASAGEPEVELPPVVQETAVMVDEPAALVQEPTLEEAVIEPAPATPAFEEITPAASLDVSPQLASTEESAVAGFDSEPEPVKAFAAAAVATFSEAAPQQAEPQASTGEDRIAQAIQRVLDRLKPQIVTEIARELAKEDN